MSTNSSHDGWDLRESGPSQADHSVLLLPGALCTAAFFENLMADPKLREASIRLVATTLQGFGGSPPPGDLSMENYARRAGQLAADPPRRDRPGRSLGDSLQNDQAPELAASQGGASWELKRFGIADVVVPERTSADREPQAFVARLGAVVEHELRRLLVQEPGGSAARSPASISVHRQPEGVGA